MGKTLLLIYLFKELELNLRKVDFCNDQLNEYKIQKI